MPFFLIGLVLKLIGRSISTLLLIALSIGITLGVSWLVFSFTQNTYVYQKPWMMPLLLGIGAFVGGIVSRAMADSEKHGMTMLLWAGLAQLGFAGLVWIDLHIPTFSRWMPETIRPNASFAYTLPIIGMAGFLFSRLFRLR